MKYNRIVILTAAVATLPLCGCQREELNNHTADGILNFSVCFAGSGEITLTKGATLTSEDGSVSVPLSCAVTDGIEVKLPGSAEPMPATKGTQINSEDEFLDAGLTSFTVEGWNADKSSFLPSTSVNYSDGKWQTAESYQWTDSDDKVFLAYANLSSSASATNYVNPSVKQTFTYTVPTDARQQNDIMLGWYEGNGGGTATASITMVHPLTAVVFKKGVMDESITAIKSISIEGVYTDGTADVTYELSGNDIVPTYNWGNSRSGSQTVTLGPAEDATELEVGTDNVFGEPFIILPQDVAAKTLKLMITVVKDGADAVLCAYVPAGHWKEGKTNTYIIGYSHSYTFDFHLTNASQGNQTFSNTTESSSPVTIPVTSTKTLEDLTTLPQGWKIKSVKVGSADAESINATSFVDKGGLSATISEGNLVLQASARTAEGKGSHAYWVNEGGISGDEDGSDWSPKSWGADGEDKGTIDLSKYDPYTDNPAAHAMTTANCYIIRHAGTYKLPLVYGNGIVGGEINSQSYYPDATGGENRLVRFKNHLDLDGDGGIISPFIEYNTTDGLPYSEGSNSYLAPLEGGKGARVIWQDRADIITIDGISKENISVGGRNYDVSYITFTISQDVICQNNAILAVEGEDGIMWSWHIWTTNDPELLSDAISVKNFMSYEFMFFPMYCIGWVDAVDYPGREAVKIVLEQDESGKMIEINVGQNDILGKSLGCHYQWGRKDPMPTIQQPTGFNTVIGGVTTLSGSIRNPGTFYGGTNNDWLESGHYYNLWTGKFSGSGAVTQNENLIKTVYDPSPVGYKLPASSAFTGYTTNGQNTSSSMYFNVDGEFDHGWHFYTSQEKTSTIYFPGAGYRDHVYGSLVNNVTYFGEYWSAVAGYQEGYCGYYLNFEYSFIFPKATGYRNFGRSVRPVKE